MAYEQLKQRIFSQFSSPSDTLVSNPIRGTGRLPVGTHVVTITGVDTVFLDTRGYFQLTLTVGANMFERLTIYLYTKDKTAYSFRFRKLVRAVFPADTLDVYANLLDTNLMEGLQVLRGLKLQVDVEATDGYEVHATHNGYRLSTHPNLVFQTSQDLAKFATDNNLTRATPQIVGVKPYGQSSNARALYTAIETLNASGVPPCTTGT